MTTLFGQSPVSAIGESPQSQARAQQLTWRPSVPPAGLNSRSVSSAVLNVTLVPLRIQEVDMKNALYAFALAVRPLIEKALLNGSLRYCGGRASISRTRG